MSGRFLRRWACRGGNLGRGFYIRGRRSLVVRSQCYTFCRGGEMPIFIFVSSLAMFQIRDIQRLSNAPQELKPRPEIEFQGRFLG